MLAVSDDDGLVSEGDPNWLDADWILDDAPDGWGNAFADSDSDAG
ncbi:hypothetical protein [Vasconcelosia minhoensis]|nr:hypothetical protein [Romeria gracilis]